MSATLLITTKIHIVAAYIRLDCFSWLLDEHTELFESKDAPLRQIVQGSSN